MVCLVTLTECFNLTEWYPLDHINHNPNTNHDRLGHFVSPLQTDELQNLAQLLWASDAIWVPGKLLVNFNPSHSVKLNFEQPNVHNSIMHKCLSVHSTGQDFKAIEIFTLKNIFLIFFSNLTRWNSILGQYYRDFQIKDKKQSLKNTICDWRTLVETRRWMCAKRGWPWMREYRYLLEEMAALGLFCKTWTQLRRSGIGGNRRNCYFCIVCFHWINIWKYCVQMVWMWCQMRSTLSYYSHWTQRRKVNQVHWKSLVYMKPRQKAADWIKRRHSIWRRWFRSRYWKVLKGQSRFKTLCRLIVSHWLWRTKNNIPF